MELIIHSLNSGNVLPVSITQQYVLFKKFRKMNYVRVFSHFLEGMISRIKGFAFYQADL